MTSPISRHAPVRTPVPVRPHHVAPPEVARESPRRRPADVYTPPVAPPAPLTRRERAVEHMLRFVPERDTELRSAIRSASSSFSDRQLIRMDRAGVVFAANRVG